MGLGLGLRTREGLKRQGGPCAPLARPPSSLESANQLPWGGVWSADQRALAYPAAKEDDEEGEKNRRSSTPPPPDGPATSPTQRSAGGGPPSCPGTFSGARARRPPSSPGTSADARARRPPLPTLPRSPSIPLPSPEFPS